MCEQHTRTCRFCRRHFCIDHAYEAVTIAPTAAGSENWLPLSLGHFCVECGRSGKHRHFEPMNVPKALTNWPQASDRQPPPEIPMAVNFPAPSFVASIALPGEPPQTEFEANPSESAVSSAASPGHWPATEAQLWKLATEANPKSLEQASEQEELPGGEHSEPSAPLGIYVAGASAYLPKAIAKLPIRGRRSQAVRVWSAFAPA